MQPQFSPLYFMVLPQKEERESLIPHREARQSYLQAAGLRWQLRAGIQASPNTRPCRPHLDLCHYFTMSQRRCGSAGAALMVLVSLMTLSSHPFWCRVLGSAKEDTLTIDHNISPPWLNFCGKWQNPATYFAKEALLPLGNWWRRKG